ncbi:DNA adenine methylase [Luteimonas fraxinea]|uniref:site-specific DNA-methyltransferase (adenine-specific) n=1 Tax=Luteimonas fraxinea TaxID=2901869 RepID=A0ABS8UC46_9GAMM|nr:DNA adenine methylase [Luteimonas fraxinea]MCD9096804.1 DNA adenine methylase [Luteimonas fraxinea]
MKYMGSKRGMLRNGLGKIILEEAQNCTRFIDLFTGSGAVASFVATNVRVPVHAYDLQQYGRVLAGAVVERTQLADYRVIWKNWRARALRHFNNNSKIIYPLCPSEINQQVVRNARAMCALANTPLTKAYGGHYYSPYQALWLDSLRATVPAGSALELAALVDAASECAASPGHTAQPFQPTETALQHLSSAWSKDVLEKTLSALKKISRIHAKKPGIAAVADANDAALSCRSGDLVFVDPPYSALQYSRFYHVLESVVTGEPGSVEGVGRYPDASARPTSSFSMKSKASASMRELLKNLSAKGVTVILTFPDHECSNGLSASKIKEISSDYFCVREISVQSKMSTLGGAGLDCIENEIRGARRDASESILILS